MSLLCGRVVQVQLRDVAVVGIPVVHEEGEVSEERDLADCLDRHGPEQQEGNARRGNHRPVDRERDADRTDAEPESGRHHRDAGGHDAENESRHGSFRDEEPHTGDSGDHPQRREPSQRSLGLSNSHRGLQIPRRMIADSARCRSRGPLYWRNAPQRNAPYRRCTRMSGSDTAWLLISTALVLMMTPALGLFYGGLVREKNALNTIMMSFSALGFVGIAWALLGYSIAFDTGNALFGGFGFALLRNVRLETHGTIPHVLFMCY